MSARSASVRVLPWASIDDCTLDAYIKEPTVLSQWRLIPVSSRTYVTDAKATAM